ncbi:hypothetical protein CYMTET_41883 [Cymbomonas tetramitiformis]|uniref:Protein FAM221A n=1 Tax=Cymbomonas tetramitiformis TaxID=36881 RepID=A0AAE0C6I7_9CHLO|nr:hypothetical protein CYMTET_41883 [Cymbomonas tetramitiformis]
MSRAGRGWQGDDPNMLPVHDYLREEYHAAGVDTETLRINSEAANHVQAYLEYERIVGHADNGQLLSEEEYAAFRAKAAVERANRIYVSWRCDDTGMDCKMIGPKTKCLCGHMYKQHITDNMTGKQKHRKDVHCGVAGCACPLFDYIPSHGTWAIKCNCKHEAEDHHAKTRRCGRQNCGCRGFTSSFACSCGLPYTKHTTTFETRDEREACGRPVDNLCGGGAMYEALGGITRHASLADGYERQDKVLPMTDLGLLPHHPQSSAVVAADLRRDALPAAEATRLLRGKMAASGGRTRAGGRAITGSSEDESGASFSQPMSAAQAYAAKKAAAMEKAAAIREQRRIAQGQQMHGQIAHADQPYGQGLAEESELDVMYRLSKQRLGR